MNGMDGENIVVPTEQNRSGSKLRVGLELEAADIALKGAKEGFGDKLNERPSLFNNMSNGGKSRKQDV
jgi:hypothetical protein